VAPSRISPKGVAGKRGACFTKSGLLSQAENRLIRGDGGPAKTGSFSLFAMRFQLKFIGILLLAES